ncbi:MAG TPA: hypothetical protein PKA27_11575 [Fimbriimonadaceae bacterium]|nr:hypothetical protein [Fimbriimonadaceae bacterium]
MKARILFGLALTATSVLASAQSVTLKLKLTSGKTYKYQTLTDMQQAAQGMSMPMKIDQVMNLKVGAKTAKGYSVTHSVSSAKVTVPKDSPMASMSKSIEDSAKKATFTSIYSETGKIVQAGKVQGGLPGMQNQNGFSAGFMGVEYPKTPVSVGTKWTASIDISEALGSTGMKVDGKPIVVTYKVTKIETKNGKTLVTLATTMNGKSSGSMKAGQNQPGGTMNLSINGSGTTVVDAATGLPVSSKMTAKNVIGFGGMSMTQNMTVTSTLK